MSRADFPHPIGAFQSDVATEQSGPGDSSANVTTSRNLDFTSGGLPQSNQQCLRTVLQLILDVASSATAQPIRQFTPKTIQRNTRQSSGNIYEEAIARLLAASIPLNNRVTVALVERLTVRLATLYFTYVFLFYCINRGNWDRLLSVPVQSIKRSNQG